MKLAPLVFAALLAAPLLPAQTTYFAEDFDAGFPPAGWTTQSNGSVGAWSDGSAFSWRFLIVNDMAFHTNFAGGQADTRLITPPIDLSNAGSQIYVHWFDYKARLNYQAHHPSSVGNGKSSLEVSIDGGVSWFPYWVESRDSGAADSPHVDLSLFSGESDVRLAFRYEGSDAHEWGIDEVRVDNSPYGSVRSMVNPANGHTYIQCYKGTWNEAVAIAAYYGGEPVAINDAAENQWLWENFSKWSSSTSTTAEFIQRSLWTGGNDVASEGTWEWTTGESFSYTNWNPGEPNNDTANDPNGEDHLRMDSGDGEWLDKHEAASLFVVVEIDRPLYSTSGLIAGQQGQLILSNMTPSGSAIFAYSVRGAGPTPSPWGDVAMSLPITQLPPISADASGTATFSVSVPPAAQGVTIYTQALDVTVGLLSNPLVETVL